MASDIVTGSSTTYLTIIGGNLKQKVSEDTDGAKERIYEKKDGSEGSKFELSHRNVRGKLAAFDFDKKDFGVTMLEIVIIDEDGLKTQISTPDNSRYASDFMEKLPNIDLSQEIVFNTYDFEPKNGKRKTGVSIIQGKDADGEPNKIQTAYFDFEKKKPLRGLPQPTGDVEEYETDDWKMYYLQKKKFLVKATKKIFDDHVASQNVTSESVKPKKKASKELEADDVPF
jgi:hypothetical protein